MFKQKLRLAIFCGLILILSLSLLACSDDDEQEEIINEYDFELVVADSNQNGINNAQVRFDDNTDETNSEGVVVFSDLEAGIYSLSVEADGYKKYEDNIEVGADAQNHRVELVEEKATEVEGELIIVSRGSTSEDNGDLTLDYDILMSEYPTTFFKYEEYVEDTETEMPDDEGWGKDSLPVINITYEDTVQYANWLSEQEGLEPAYDDSGELKDQPEYLEGYRLPTSEEWEYAARGGPNGEATTYAGSDEINEVGWHLNNSDSTMPVGEKKANELDLYDMSGNVEEWTDTQADSKYIARGGAWRYVKGASTVDAKEGFEPDEKNDALGFRLVRTADFTLYSLDIAAEGNGGVNIDPSREGYRGGDTITLRASSDEGWEFKNWSGDINSTDNPVDATIDDGEIEIANVEDSLNVIANFSREEFSVATNTEGKGEVTPDLDNKVYKYEDTIEVTANPAEGYHLAEWQGIDKEDNENIEVEVRDDLDITAVFEINSYDVVFKDYDGSVLKEETVDYGGSASAPSKPEREGHNFTGWNTEFDNVTEDLTINAEYEIKTDKLNIDINGEGNYNLKPIKDEYEYGDEISIAANPKEGWRFESWSGDIESTDNPVNATIKGGEIKVASVGESLNITANFKRKKFSVITNTKGKGEITPDLDNKSYEYEDTIELTANPAEGYYLVEWQGVDKEDNENIEVEVRDDLDITAVFEINSYDVLFKDYDGSVIKEEKVDYGNSASPPSKPEREQYDFTGWDTEFDDVTENLIVTANYEVKTFSPSIRTIGEGDVEINPDENKYKYGEEITIEAIANTGWKFAGWDGDLSGTDKEKSIKIDKDMDIIADFERERYNLSFTAENGEIDVSLEQDEYKYGTEIELEANPAEGYGFVEWRGDVSGIELGKDITVGKAMEIEAVFGELVDIKTSVKGEGSIEGETNDVAVGREVKLKAVADENWKFVKWSGDINSTDSEITINNVKNVTAYFVEKVEGMIFVLAGKTSENNGSVKVEDDFHIGKYHVTQAEFEEVMGFNPSRFNDRNLTGYTANRPVEQVTWYDAVKYANELSEEEGLEKYYNISDIEYDTENWHHPQNIVSATVTENEEASGYRLPTENEHEYAARGGENGEATTYAGSDNLDEVGWYYNNSDEANSNKNHNRGTMPVGRKKSNELGLYDMSGNVFDWTNTTSTNSSISLGASWYEDADYCEIGASRSYWQNNTISSWHGFRLVRTP